LHDMSRRAARRDANHTEVGDYLRDHGWSVLDLADLGDGCPDYAVSKGSFTALVEVKDGSKPPSARQLTPKEQQVKDGWQGAYVIALDPEDAIAKLMVEQYLSGRGE
jgi:hypothetical protein